MIKRRSLLGNTEKVTFVKSLTSTGTQCFILDADAADDNTIYIDFQLKSKPFYGGTATNDGQSTMCGCYTINSEGTNYQYYPLYLQGSMFRILKKANKTFSDTVYFTVGTERHVLIYNNVDNKATFDGTVKHSDLGETTDIVSGSKLGLLCRTIYSKSSSKVYVDSSSLIKATIYEVKVYDRNTQELLQHYLPALDKDNHTCLVDIINNKFYYNAYSDDEFEYDKGDADNA